MTGIYTLLGALLKLMYNLIGHYGWAIVAFTVAVKLLLMPLMQAQNRSMKAMTEVQPKIEELKKKYPNNQEKQNEAMVKLYKDYNVNPLLGCLPMLVQLPILIGLFRVLREPVTFVFKSEAAMKAADTGFYWIKSMASPDVITIGGLTLPFILPLIAAISTYYDSKTMSKGQPQNQMTTTMTYMMPLMILLWGRSFPAGLSLYWAVSNVFSILQRKLLNPKVGPDAKDSKVVPTSKDSKGGKRP